MFRIFGFLALLLMLFLSAACTPAATDTRPDGPRPVSWVITGHRAPGISAMTNEQAEAYYGRLIGFGPKQAKSGDDACDLPVYETTTEPAADILALDYKIRPEDLGLPEGSQLEVMRVICSDHLWTTVGSVVLWDAADHGFAVWDGVFFELTPAE